MTNIIVVEDHSLFRQGLITILEEQHEVEVVAQYQNGKEFIEALEIKAIPKADMIFLDISMPWLSGLEVLKIIERKGYIIPPICMLSMYPEHFYLKQVKELGAKGYLNKDIAIEDLRTAIDSIVTGGFAFSDERQSKKNKETPSGYLENLSSREVEVFKCLTQGMTVKEIAFDLDISVKTISTYKTRLMDKLGAETLSDLLKLALMYESEG